MIFLKRLRGFPFLAVFIAAGLIAAMVLFLERWEDPAPYQTDPSHSRKGETRGKGMTRGTPEGGTPSGSERRGQRISVIIDDIGFDLALVQDLAKMKAPIAGAILPHAPHAAEAAAILHAAGKEVLLHLPMEPRAYPAENPGAGALFVDMDAKELRARTAAALAAVPHVLGVNNHMGSRFMEEETGVAIVLEELSRRGLFFVDSLTSGNSRGKEQAAQAGIRFAARDRFIDHAPGYEAALTALIHPPRQDQSKKELLLIGHPHPETLRALQAALSDWRREGIRVIPVSAYVRIPHNKGNGRNDSVNQSLDQMPREGNP